MSASRDGWSSSIRRPAVVEQNYTYGVNPNGTQWTQVSRGSGANAPWTKTTTDWVGRTVSEERSGPNGNIVRNLGYDWEGNLAAESNTGLGTRTYGLTHTGAGGAIVSTSTLPTDFDGDRYESVAEYYKLTGSEWYHVRATTRGTENPVTTTVKEKVGGFGATEIAKTVSSDAFGQTTTTVTTVDRTTHQVRRETMRDGIANHAVSISRAGLTQSFTSFSGTQTIYGYDGLGRQTSVQSTLSGNVGIAYEPVFGQVRDVTAGSQTTHYDYYGMGESDPSPGRVKARTVNGLTTYFSYDGLGRLVKTWGPAAYPLWYEYDAHGRFSKLHTYRTGTDALWSGAAWPESAGIGDVTTWVYVLGTDALEKKLDARGKGASYTYSPSGLLETRTWARGAVTTYVFNGAAELNGITYTNGGGVPTHDVSLSYDELGHPSSVEDAAGVHTLAYDAVGQLQSDTLDASGVLAGVGLTVGHDGFGRFNHLEAHLGATPLLGPGQTFDYEAATGRMHSVTDGINTAVYGYRAGTDWLETTTISRAGAPATVTVRTPDALGRLGTIATTRGGVTKENHTWRYNAAGQRDRDTLADGSYWAYTYNSRGEVTGGAKHFGPAVAGYANAAVNGYGYGYSFDPIGNRTRTVVNGRTAGYAANDLNQYERRGVPPAVDVLGSADAGAVVSVTTVPANPNGPQTARRQGELFSAAVPVDNQAGPQAPMVTITGRKVTGAGGPQVTSTESGKVFLAKQPEEFAYDLDGNTLSDGQWSYTWDGENRLVAVETRAAAVAAGVAKTKIEYTYDARSRRIARTVRSGWNGSDYAPAETRGYVYGDGWNVLAELKEVADGFGNVSQVLVRRNVWGLDVSGSLDGAGGIGGLLVESIMDPSINDPNNVALTDCLPFYDGNGNIIGLIDPDGNEVARYTYGPFGETVGMSGLFAAANPYRWSTKWTEDVTGLKDYGYRWLGVGRWLNRDPLEEDGGENLYNYVANDGIGRIDPSGMRDIASSGIRPYPSIDNGAPYAKPSSYMGSVADRFKMNVNANDNIGSNIKGFPDSVITGTLIHFADAYWKGHNIAEAMRGGSKNGDPGHRIISHSQGVMNALQGIREFARHSLSVASGKTTVLLIAGSPKISGGRFNSYLKDIVKAGGNCLRIRVLVLYSPSDSSVPTLRYAPSKSDFRTPLWPGDWKPGLITALPKNDFGEVSVPNVGHDASATYGLPSRSTHYSNNPQRDQNIQEKLRQAVQSFLNGGGPQSTVLMP